MIQHVVMWKLRGPSPEERQAQAEDVRQALEGLRGKIAGMSSLQVGVGARGDEQRSDVVLITTHEDWDALAAYQAHPAHVAAAQVIGALRSERRVLDFEVADGAALMEAPTPADDGAPTDDGAPSNDTVTGSRGE